MIPGDIGARLAGIVRAAADAGELPESAIMLTASGTWRPAPAEAGGGPGTYATALPFALAKLADLEPRALAGRLGAGLDGVPWISSARPTGAGHLTVTVTGGHLTGLADRIIAAGPAAARSTALAGSRLTAPRSPGPSASWYEAWRSQRDVVVGRLAQAAGAKVNFICPQRSGPAASPGQAGLGPVPVAVACHGPDAVRYALARTASGEARAIERQLSVPNNLANPFVAVSYAHADAASTLRWAAELAGPQSEPEPDREAITLPPELRLLDLLSWLPERVAAAARRDRPAELTSYLENLADAWLDCQASCPALPFRGGAAARDPAVRAARLLLGDAARVTLAAGLHLLGVAAPARI